MELSPLECKAPKGSLTLGLKHRLFKLYPMAFDLVELAASAIAGPRFNPVSQHEAYNWTGALYDLCRQKSIVTKLTTSAGASERAKACIIALALYVYSFREAIISHESI
jgi:hypothetical protein